MRITHYFDEELVSVGELQPDDEEVLEDLEGGSLLDCKKYELKGVRTIAVLDCEVSTVETLIEFDEDEVVSVVDWRKDGEYTGLTNDSYTILSIEKEKVVKYIIIENEPYIIGEEDEVVDDTNRVFMKMVLDKYDHVISHN